jgi:hypothetical protein
MGELGNLWNQQTGLCFRGVCGRRCAGWDYGAVRRVAEREERRCVRETEEAVQQGERSVELKGGGRVI